MFILNKEFLERRVGYVLCIIVQVAGGENPKTSICFLCQTSTSLPKMKIPNVIRKVSVCIELTPTLCVEFLPQYLPGSQSLSWGSSEGKGLACGLLVSVKVI